MFVGGADNKTKSLIIGNLCTLTHEIKWAIRARNQCVDQQRPHTLPAHLRRDHERRQLLRAIAVRAQLSHTDDLGKLWGCLFSNEEIRRIQPQQRIEVCLAHPLANQRLIRRGRRAQGNAHKRALLKTSR